MTTVRIVLSGILIFLLFLKFDAKLIYIPGLNLDNDDHVPVISTTTTSPMTTTTTATTKITDIDEYNQNQSLNSNMNTSMSGFQISANTLRERFSFDEKFFKELGIDEETFFRELGLGDDLELVQDEQQITSTALTTATTTATTTSTTTTLNTTTTTIKTTETSPEILEAITEDYELFQSHSEETARTIPIQTDADDCVKGVTKKIADKNVCNMYYLCINGTMHVLLCPSGYLYSEQGRECETSERVNCGPRMVLGFDNSDATTTTTTTIAPTTTSTTTRATTLTTTQRTITVEFKPRTINGTLDCPLGLDGYYADSEFCNVYHHCLAGVDNIDQCPTPLVWNDKKKMCDWHANTNCSGKLTPIAHGQKSFCSDRADGKYKDPEFCNLFHHCLSGNDNLMRCENELFWNDREQKCDQRTRVVCSGKILPADKTTHNSTFCVDKDDGLYAHEEYCNVYHACEAGSDNIRKCPNQLSWDVKSNRCEWPSKVECTGRRLTTLSTEATLFCLERVDGVYGDPVWCNIYHTCLSGIDYKTKCPENLIWSETKKGCDWSDTTRCQTGKLYKNATDTQQTFCGERQNGKYAHELFCNRYYVCQNGKDIIFTCQNNLRYNAQREECDWAVNVDCQGKKDYMWEGIKDNFCKSKPDGNYEDPSYCNIFHQCQAAMDYPKRCSNRLMFNAVKGECDWEDQVDCRQKDKLIDIVGLENESKPENNDGKGRVTKFCMSKPNGNYGDLYYCNIYHNCHGGFDTVQYCANGLVWRQEDNTTGSCDWPLTSNIANGVDCGVKKIFFVNKQSNVDIMTSLRSEFCITRGEGLFVHPKYCDMYIQCTAQAVAITMECGAGLMFNERKNECDYPSSEHQNFNQSITCPPSKQMLRPIPKADGTLIFNGTDVTGMFPTKFKCDRKSQQQMLVDEDWCNIYHVCADRRDNIFICPPGTVFNQKKQGCFDRFAPKSCGTSKYFKPHFRQLVNGLQTTV